LGRHIVDTLGLLEVVVSAANVSSWGEAVGKIRPISPRLQKIFADGGYDGKDFMASVKEDYQLDWSSSASRPRFRSCLGGG